MINYSKRFLITSEVFLFSFGGFCDFFKNVLNLVAKVFKEISKVFKVFKVISSYLYVTYETIKMPKWLQRCIQ